MATQRSTVDYLLEQCGRAGAVTAKKMFGEYGIYCGSKLVALVCDDRLFVKPTSAGKKHLVEVVEAVAYPGAKPSYLVTDEKWDDADWLSGLISATAADLPVPAPKKRPKRTQLPA